MKKKAQSLFEYSLIIVLIVIIAVAGIQFFSKKISASSRNSAEYLTPATSSSKTSVYAKMCEEAKGTWDNGVCHAKVETAGSTNTSTTTSTNKNDSQNVNLSKGF